jgi:hypothetical protein
LNEKLSERDVIPKESSKYEKVICQSNSRMAKLTFRHINFGKRQKQLLKMPKHNWNLTKMLTKILRSNGRSIRSRLTR